MPVAKSIEWETPRSLFDELHREFDFTLDPCASVQNAKLPKYYTVAQDGLKQSWKDERVFMNPPYGLVIRDWAEKAFVETSSYFDPAELVVALIPARTDTRWFHGFVYGKAEIRFLKGRLKFEILRIPQDPAPFPCMVVIWRRANQ